jgi:hypothetical protein
MNLGERIAGLCEELALVWQGSCKKGVSLDNVQTELRVLKVISEDKHTRTLCLQESSYMVWEQSLVSGGKRSLLQILTGDAPIDLSSNCHDELLVNGAGLVSNMLASFVISADCFSVLEGYVCRVITTRKSKRVATVFLDLMCNCLKQRSGQTHSLSATLIGKLVDQTKIAGKNHFVLRMKVLELFSVGMVHSERFSTKTIQTICDFLLCCYRIALKERFYHRRRNLIRILKPTVETFTDNFPQFDERSDISRASFFLMHLTPDIEDAHKPVQSEVVYSYSTRIDCLQKNTQK